MDVRIDGEVIVMMIGVEMVAHYLTTGLKYQAVSNIPDYY